MRLTLNVLGCLCFLLCLVSSSDAKDWRGIVPLHSTRADVEKLLGPPPPPPSDGTQIYSLNAGRSIYKLGEGEVYIVYANENTEGWNDCAGKVPEGTVLLIYVTPKNQMSRRFEARLATADRVRGLETQGSRLQGLFGRRVRYRDTYN